MLSTRNGSPHLVEDGKTVKLNNPSNWTLTGYSRAGERTSFRLNEFDVLLDCGMPIKKMVKNIFLTHTHVDHCWALPNLLGGKVINKNECVDVHFPKQSYPGLLKLMDAALTLSHPKKTFTEEEMWTRNGLNPVLVEAGDILNFRSYSVECLQAVHTANALGYGFFKTKEKLKKEYLDLDTKALIALKISGEIISEKIMSPEFAFFCDSTIHNLLNYNQWKKYPTIVVESTGFEDSHSPATIREHGHTHFDELLPIMTKHKDKNWILIHSSLKTDDAKLRDKENELRSSGLCVTIVV